MWLLGDGVLSWIITGLVVFLVSLYLYGTWNHGLFKSLGINGPKPKPFIGTLFDGFSEAHFGLYDVKAKKKYGKMIGYFDGRQTNIVVYDPDILREFLSKESNSFHSRRKLYMRSWLRHSVVDQRTYDDWKRVRNILTPFFSTGKLKQQTLPINKAVDTLINNLKSRKDGDFEAKKTTDAFTLDAICATAFGIQIDSQNNPNDPLIKTLRTINDAITGVKLILPAIVPHVFAFLEWVGLGEYVRLMPQVFDFMSDFIERMMRERMTSKEDVGDFVKAMVDAHDKHERQKTEGDEVTRGLSDVEIKAQAFVFVLAGYDTTSTALSFLMHNLAVHPDIQDKVYAEIQGVLQGRTEATYDDINKLTYLDMCIDETLRLYPPLLRFDREADRDITLGGVTLPKGMIVTAPVWALHHDPEIWDEPEKFDPERFSPQSKQDRHPFVYMPFGMGPRNCIGNRLATKEIKLCMTKILLNFKLVPNSRTENPPVLARSLFLMTKNGLHLSAKPR